MEITEAELKAKIKEAVDAATEEAVEGLKKKNTELIGKLKAAQKDSQIDPAEHQALQAELDQAKTQIAELQKVAKTATTEAEKAKKALEGESGFISRLIIDNGLTEAIIKSGVKPEMSKAVKALLAGQVTIKTDGDKREAVIGDKSLSDFVGEWAKSDEGKHFVAATNNQGGNAQGGGGGKGAFDFSKMSSIEKMEAGRNATKQ